MQNQKNNHEYLTMLRQKAIIQQKQILSKKDPNLSKSDILKLLCELELHQIELQMQNEELLLAKNRGEVLALKFSDLYDSAPSAYFPLTRDGTILDLNISGSKMPGKHRNKLINSRYGFFVSQYTRPAFNLFLNKLFESKSDEVCEVILEVNNRYCRMSGYTEREMKAINLSDIEDAVLGNAMKFHIPKIISHGQVHFESRHRRKDGSTYDVEVSGQYQPTAGGQFVTFVHEITERKQAELALNQLNELLED